MKQSVHNKRIIQTMLLLLGIVVVFSSIIFLANDHRDTHVREYNNGNTPPTTEQITLSIEGLYVERAVSVQHDDTLLDVLTTLNESDPALMLSLNEYEGLGTLVTGMAGKQNGDGNRYWQYMVNDELPMVGADTYKLTGGETVEWVFITSEF